MNAPPPDLFARARSHRHRLRALLAEVDKTRALLGDEIDQLINNHGLSERTVAAEIGYRSSTSVRRARARRRRAADAGSPA